MMKLLVKEIKSKAGELHFRRWRLLQLPFFAVYIHGIYKSDGDIHPHSHPWSFISLILKGSYTEDVWYKDLVFYQFTRKLHYQYPVFKRKTFSIIGHTRQTYHKIKVTNGPVYTLVFTFGFKKDWGYLVNDNFVHYRKYRDLKNLGELYEFTK